MRAGPIEIILIAWAPIVVALFYAIEPRRAVLIGLLGGYLFLPTTGTNLTLMGHAIPLDKNIATGVGLIVGVLAFDRRTLFATRFRWTDLPMVAYYLIPLIGLVTGIPGSSADLADQMLGRGLGWVVPYAMGRIYFGGGDGPASVAVGLMIAGLSQIPICLYEEIVGPSHYLMTLIYGLPAHMAMVERLGGWRPEGFLHNGLVLASWMAATTVTAFWLWLGGWHRGRWTAWAPALALLIATLSCRGIYGYLMVAIGLTTALLTRWFRTRAILASLIIVPFLYMGLRSTGAWDGGLIRGAARSLGREGTIDWRLRAEDQVIARVLEHNPIVGFGQYIWNAKGLTVWPDGGWLHALWMGGLVGLALWMGALHIWPAALALARPPGRPDARQAVSPTWALACWCILQMIDGLHNGNYLPPTALIAGTLVGSWASKPTDPFRDRQGDTGRHTRRKEWPVALIVTAIILILIEIVGRLPRPKGSAPVGVSAEKSP